MSERLEKAKEYREQRATLADENAKIVAAAKDRELTAEERTSFDNRFKAMNDLKAKAEEIEADYDRITRQAETERELAASRGTRAGQQDRSGSTEKTPEQRQMEYSRKRDTAFRVWAANGSGDLTSEERDILGLTNVSQDQLPEGTDPRLARKIQSGVTYRLRSVPANPDQRRVWNKDTLRFEERANEPQASSSNGFGGYSVANEPMRALEDALLQFGGMRQARCTVLRTQTGGSLPIPTGDDTGNKGAILNENSAQSGATPLAYGQVIMQAFKYSSKFVLASLEFLQDTSIANPESYIASKLGERLGRITNDHFTKGSNSSQPNGVAWAATLGKTAASATALTYKEIIDLRQSVDPSYRGNGEYMFSDGTLTVIMKLEDSYGRPLWLPGIAVREPDRILGQTYVVNQSMDSAAAGKHSVLYGDFSKYFIRDVMDITVLRLVERYAEYAQVGFIAFSRHDGDLVDAGTHPIKYLRHPAS